MQDDFNKDPFKEDDYEEHFEEQPSQQVEQKQEIPRWTPYEDSCQQPGSPKKPQESRKQKRRWVVPLVIVLAIMIVAITVGVIYGANRLTAYMRNVSKQEMISQENQGQDQNQGLENNTPDSSGENAEISTADTNSLKEASYGKYILTDVSDIVEEVIPAVVSITSRQLVENGGYGDYFDFFFGGGYSGNFGGSNGGESQEVESGVGSGTIISQNDTELLILTSYHVVEGSSSFYITFTDGASVDGYIKSQSDADDIAIVAVPLTDITEETKNAIKVAKLSTREAEVGEGVIVIGNALGYGMSVTSGIISATNRQIQADGKTITVMQTDAAINGGNSGGCVLDKNGEIIGISEAKSIASHVEGMCYAIPVSSNTELIQSLMAGTSASADQESGQNTSEQTAYLGIRGRDIDDSLANSYGMPKGVYVGSTISGSGAEAAGLQEGDIIVGMDNVSFSTMSQLQEQLSRHNPGDQVMIIFMREVDGAYTQMKANVTLSGAIS